jgi:hypothetical protein
MEDDNIDMKRRVWGVKGHAAGQSANANIQHRMYKDLYSKSKLHTYSPLFHCRKGTNIKVLFAMPES